MTYPQKIDQVWLFGSKARDDSKLNSDTDILVVSDAESVNDIRDQLVKSFGDGLDVAHYTYAGIERVIANSSLFAVHLRDEGIPLFERSGRLYNMLSTMPEYNAHKQDLKLLGELLNDASLSLDSGTLSLVFELGILGTIVRNTGIIMTSHLKKTDFSTEAPLSVALLEETLAMPISEDTYRLLQDCRKAGERGTDVDLESMNAVNTNKILGLVRDWHSECIKYVEGRI